MEVYLLKVEVYEDVGHKDKCLYSLDVGIYKDKKKAYSNALNEIIDPILIDDNGILPNIIKIHEFEFFKRRLIHSDTSMIGGSVNDKYTKNVFVKRMEVEK